MLTLLTSGSQIVPQDEGEGAVTGECLASSRRQLSNVLALLEGCRVRDAIAGSDPRRRHRAMVGGLGGAIFSCAWSWIVAVKS